MQANAEICQTASKPFSAHVESVSRTPDADKEEMENGGQIDPLTVC